MEGSSIKPLCQLRNLRQLLCKSESSQKIRLRAFLSEKFISPTQPGKARCQKAITSYLTASGHMNVMNQPRPSGWWAQCKPIRHLDPVLILHLHISKAFCAHAWHILLSCLLLSWLQIRTLHSEHGYPVARTAKDAFAPACVTGSFAALLFKGSPILHLTTPKVSSLIVPPLSSPPAFQTGEIESSGMILALEDIPLPTEG